MDQEDQEEIEELDEEVEDQEEQEEEIDDPLRLNESNFVILKVGWNILEQF